MPATSRFAGEPITDDDATISAMLDDLSVPALLLSMVHMTGDETILDGPDRPLGNYLNEVQGFMSPESQAAVRARALDVIRSFRDGGHQLPPPPTPATLRRMMDFLLGQEIPEEYVPLLVEELELDGVDLREVVLDPTIGADVKEAFHVVVIGAGMSGLLAGIRLGQAGIPYTIVEKNAGAGGTWWENRYPGCRVDVGNHFYCYSFAPDDHWTEFFAQQPELQAYFDHCMHRYDVESHVRFGTEVMRARWDDEEARWTVETRGADGATSTLVGNAVVSAVGQLNRPKIPDFPGLDSFAGTVMHSARWDPEVALAGRRVAVVGTGASAFQVVPTIAPDVERLTVFQRSAPWMFPNPHYHDAVGPGVPWAIRHLPFYGRWYRFLLFWPACDGGLPAMRVDPDWPHQDRAVSEINDAAREFFTGWMAEQIGDDPELLAKVVPDYVCLGKRTLQDNGTWLTALTRENVELVTEPITKITSAGVVDATGTEHEVDVLVFATGFHANRYLWPMEIAGRNGMVLSEQWGDEPTANLGITMPNFPNLFCLYGPGTNLAHGGSMIFHGECQVRYLMGCLEQLLLRPNGVMECRQDAHDTYIERFDAEHAGMIWSHPSIRNSWYRNEAGRVTVLSPWRLVDYWAWTRQPNLAEFDISSRG